MKNTRRFGIALAATLFALLAVGGPAQADGTWGTGTTPGAVVDK